MVGNVRVAKVWNEHTESGGIPGSQLLIWLGGGWAPCLGIELLWLALLCEGKGAEQWGRFRQAQRAAPTRTRSEYQLHSDT